MNNCFQLCHYENKLHYKNVFTRGRSDDDDDNDDDVCTRPICLIGTLQCACSITETTVRGQTYRPTWIHCPDFESTSLFSYSLKLRVQRRSSRYQFYSHWLTRVRLERTRERTLIFTPPMRFYTCMQINVIDS